MTSRVTAFQSFGADDNVKGQSEMLDALRRLLPRFLRDGNLVTVAVVAGTNRILHKLGRVPNGFVLLNAVGGAPIEYPVTLTTSTNTASELYLDFGSEATVTLWVW